jgi:hypothetical protein
LLQYQIAHRMIEILPITGTSSVRTFLENQLNTSIKSDADRSEE